MEYSIIICAYNIEKFIQRCIDSVLNNNFTDYEIIIVDDGSTDNTAAIIDKYKTNQHVKIFHNKNQGLGLSRNFGLKHSKGKYVWFIDGDDFISLKSLKTLDSYVNRYPDVDVFSFDYCSFSEKCSTKMLTSIGIDPNCLFTYNPSVCFKIYKKEFLIKNDLKFSDKYYEDLEFSTIVSALKPKFYHITENLYYYVVRKDSIIHSTNFNQKKDDIYDILTYLKESFCELFYSEIEYIYIYHLLYSFSLNLLSYTLKIYYKRIKKNINIVKDMFPNWRQNKYYRNFSFQKKLVLMQLWYGLMPLSKLILTIYKKFREG